MGAGSFFTDELGYISESSSTAVKSMSCDHPASSLSFVHVSCSTDARGRHEHCIGITADGTAYSWSPTGHARALGRDCNTQQQQQSARVPHPVAYSNGSHNDPRIFRGYVGGNEESGHSVLLDGGDRRTLHVAGCDRWQQLGLGSAAGGAAGYTWKRIWHSTAFVRNDFVQERMRQDDDAHCTIRDVALGGDHSVVLSSNQRDVYVFGKGSEGQLGLDGKPFVSAPVRSSKLSETDDSKKIAAVFFNSALFLDNQGGWKCDETGWKMQGIFPELSRFTQGLCTTSRVGWTSGAGLLIQITQLFKKRMVGYGR